MKEGCRKGKEMRANKKNHVAKGNQYRGLRQDRKKAHGRRKEPFNHRKERFADSPAGEEILAALLSDIFGDDGECMNVAPMVGVIELDPENGVRLKVQHPDYPNTVGKHPDHDSDDNRIRKAMTEKDCSRKDLKGSVFEGCGEEVFLSMLADLNFMAKMILEADHMMKMVSEEDVDPENARCVTYLSVRDARDILKKWNKYRNCDT